MLETQTRPRPRPCRDHDRQRRSRRSGLDAETLMLVRIAALVAVDAPPASYLLNIEAADKLELDAENVRDVLAAVAPIVGTARVVPRRRNIVKALALELEVLELEAEEEAEGEEAAVSAEPPARRPATAGDRADFVTVALMSTNAAVPFPTMPDAPCGVPSPGEADRRGLQPRLLLLLLPFEGDALSGLAVPDGRRPARGVPSPADRGARAECRR